MARVLATRLAWLRTTPFGSLVEPEVYWIIARESRGGSCSIQRSASAPVSSSVASHADRSDATGHRFELGDRGRGAERKARTGVAGNGVEAVERAAARRAGGNGDAAGVENAEECRNEFEAGRVRKHDALARKAHVLEAGGDRARTIVELSVRHRRVP